MDWEEQKRKEALEVLLTYGILGSEDAINRLIKAYHDRAQFEAIASTLRDRFNGQAEYYDTPEMLEETLKRLIQNGQLTEAHQVYFGHAAEFPRSRGGYVNAGYHQANYQSGLRLATLLATASTAQQDESNRNPEINVEYDQALYLIDLGRLAEAEDICRKLINLPVPYYSGAEGKSLYTYVARLSLCDILMLQGRLSEAQAIADVVTSAYECRDIGAGRGYSPQAEPLIWRAAIGEYVGVYRVVSGYNPFAWRAQLRALQGRTTEALADFKRAEDFQQKKFERLYEMRAEVDSWKQAKAGGAAPNESPASVTFPALMGYPAIRYAMLLTRLGCLNAAQHILSYNQARAAHTLVRLPAQAAQAAVALSDVCRLRGDYSEAARHLEHPLAWSAETGHADIACQAQLSLARLHLAQNHIAPAYSAATQAFDFAVQRDFVLYEIDSRLLLGRLAFVERDWKTAREQADKALELAADPDCRYEWAHSGALHLLAELHTHPDYQPPYHIERKELLETAQHLVNNAIAIRTRSRDPRVSNSQKLLAQIIAQGA